MVRKHIAYNDFSNWRFLVTKAAGSYLWDEKNRKIIDFTSGWNVANLGWNNLEVNEAVIKQAKRNVYVPMWTSDSIQEEYAAALTSALPKQLNAICRATGGTEANEEALKIARAATGRKKIIGFRDTYHGQSFGVMAIGYRPEYVQAIAPLVPDFIQIDFPSVVPGDSEKLVLQTFLERLEGILKKRDVAGMVVEAGIVTGWGSTLVAPNGFLTGIRKLTKQYGTFLILDEVGTGFSRLGKLFGMEIEGIVPDVATLAKGISNGAAAIGAAVVNTNVVDPIIPKTNLTSTFGWTPIACAAALATLRIHKRDKVWETADKNGKYLLTALHKSTRENSVIGSIRGIGMEIGMQFVRLGKPDDQIARHVVSKSFERGLHVIFGGNGNIQIMPPLTTPKDVLEKGVEILSGVIKQA
jgi:4-aminobutyrate aminotransferase-like enzyme